MPDSASLSRAKKVLVSGMFTCVACKGGTVFVSEERGAGPLISWIDGKDDLSGASVADKVVGKGSAFLYAILGVAEVWAAVMSDPALKVLKRYGIAATCETVVPEIKSRSRTRRCPYEDATWDIDDPAEALAAIRKKRAELSRLPITKQD